MPADILESELFVAVDPQNNNNKFWKYEHLAAPVTEGGETGDLRISWGRVGAGKPESQLRMYDSAFLQSKIREKLRGKKDETGKRVPYTKCEIIGESAATQPNSAPQVYTSARVQALAVEELGACAVTTTLVQKLAKANRHELVAATGGKMDIDLSTGIVRTALGVVTSASVKEARILLDGLAPYVSKRDTENAKYMDTLGQYLRLVPQDTGRKAGWYNTFINVQVQSQLLDQLEASVGIAEQRMLEPPKTDGTPTTARVPIFTAKLSVVNDSATITRIKRKFEDSAIRGHASSRLRPIQVYAVEVPHMATAFTADGTVIGNIKLLWHGTRMFNVLSILKRGFVLPSQLSTVQTTGAMYGPGLYFSASSTKSLNYSYGYWDSASRDANCYMFLVDVAMGKEYIPTYSGNGKRAGYDSCWAKPGQSGVINDEQIVYRTSQANIRYLVEFNDK